MSQRTSMKAIREILRLYEHGYSQRKIWKITSVSRPTIKAYLQLFISHNINYEKISKMKDDEIESIFNSENQNKVNERYSQLLQLFPGYTRELKKTGVTLHLLWEEYCSENQNPYSYSQFSRHYAVWNKDKEITMHIEHKYGDKMFVDFTGKKLKYFDSILNEEKEVEVFVSVLGGSQLTYVEATQSQKKEDFIKSCENSFHYFGGVSSAIVPDCLKSAVTKGCKYEPEINPEFLSFSHHYGTVILPARPNHPKDKALVENSVKIVYTRIFAPLRNHIFHSLNELNRAIRELLEEYNSRKMQKLSYSRREEFELNEKRVLKPLPTSKYEFKNFCKAKVQMNYHVYLREDKHYYSVPHRFRRLETVINYTQSIVEVYCKNERIAIHRREKSHGKYTTKPEHMPSHHKVFSDWSPQRIIDWGTKIGTSVVRLAQTILNHYDHPEQGFKTCMGIFHLERVYGSSRLDNACYIALAVKNYSYRFVKNVLENRMENQDMAEYLFKEEAIIYHENLRGQKHYLSKKETAYE